MTMHTSRNLVAFALIAIASLAFLSVGCSRDEGSREGSGAAAGEVQPSRTNDPEYEAKLGERVEARNELLAIRAKLIARLDEADDAEKASLQSRIDDVNKALEDERGRALTVVRERIWSGHQANEQKEPVEQ